MRLYIASFIDGQQMPVLAELQENKLIVSVDLYCVPTFSISCQKAIQTAAAAELGVDKAGQKCSCIEQSQMHLKNSHDQVTTKQKTVKAGFDIRKIHVIVQ